MVESASGYRRNARRIARQRNCDHIRCFDCPLIRMGCLRGKQGWNLNTKILVKKAKEFLLNEKAKIEKKRWIIISSAAKICKEIIKTGSCSTIECKSCHFAGGKCCDTEDTRTIVQMAKDFLLKKKRSPRKYRRKLSY